MENEVILTRLISAWLGITFGVFSLFLFTRILEDGYLYLHEPNTGILVIEAIGAAIIMLFGIWQLVSGLRALKRKGQDV